MRADAVPYDAVARLYDDAFADIHVRRDEWRWMSRHLDATITGAKPLRVLDIGCGNGALLAAMAPRLQSGVGVDVSRAMINAAEARWRSLPNLHFMLVADHHLPAPDASIDRVISFLSFRYLDWNATLPEIRRVLAPEGRLIVVDMVAARLTAGVLGVFARSALAHAVRPLRDREFHRKVSVLTRHPDWHAMLRRHPIRPRSEYAAWFQQHFPGRPVTDLNASFQRRVIAFDSGPLPSPNRVR